MEDRKLSISHVRRKFFESMASVFVVIGLSLGLTWSASAGANGRAKRNGEEKDRKSEVEDVSVKNFGKVNEHIYRGGQPDDDEYAKLASLGIKTIIDLREDAQSNARALTERSGMSYINIRLNSKRPPTMEESNRFLSFIDDQKNWPVYVHCAGGRHRTGVLIAIYRMEKDGWDAERAYGEMKDYKFYSSFGHGGMKDYVYHYYHDLAGRRSQISPEVGALATPASTQ